MGKYIKRRLHWSSGVDPWVFIYVTNEFGEEDLNEFISGTNHKHSIYDGYRGCVAEFVPSDEVPSHMFRGGILRCENEIERITKKRSSLFNDLLEKQIKEIVASRSE